MEFAQILRNLEEATDTSNYRIAQLLHCAQSTVKSWTDGKTTPSRSKLYALADVFGVSVDQLKGVVPIDYDALQKPPVRPSVGPAPEEDPDDEKDEIIRELDENPYSRALFYAMKGATPEEYKQAAELAKMIRRTGK